MPGPGRTSYCTARQKPKLSYVEECLNGRKGPVIASTDYMKLFAEQIRQWVPSKEFKVLGTDGFGRSDSRKKLRHFFEVDRKFVVLAALEALADRLGLSDCHRDDSSG